MNKKLLIILLLLSGSSAFSQVTGDYNYSIAARGFGLLQMPKVFNETEDSKKLKTYLTGVMLKFNDNQISYRLGGSYLKQSKTFFNNCTNCEVVNGDVTDYSFKLGFEKNLNFFRIQPYFGADMGYRFNKFVGLSENVNTLKRDLADAKLPILKMEASKSGFTFSPVIGVKLNIIDQLSLFAESSLDFFYSYERQESITQDLNNTRVLTKTNKAEFLLNPVSVGVIVHLGRN